MNKKLFFLPALAALFFASCSSDEPAAPNEPGNEDNTRFLAVNIMSTDEASSRAFDGGFEDGTPAESAATSALFLFYDENGNLTQTPQLVNLTSDQWSTPDSDSPAATKQATIVSIAGQKMPTSMLVVVNPTQSIRSYLNGLTLSEAKTYAANFTTSVSFIMTNSSYYNNEIVMETKLTNTNIQTSPELAAQNAVNVYVERVVAKVQVSKDKEWKEMVTPEKITVGIDTDVDLTLYPDVQGIEIANIANSARLFKNISGISGWITQWSGVNDVTNRRSYWATTDVVGYNNLSWNAINALNFDLLTNPQYVLPNTSTDQYTSVLITAILKDGQGDEAKPVEIVKWAGNYYRKANFKNQIASFLNNEGYRIVTIDADNKVTSITEFGADDVDYISNTKHQSLSSGSNPKLKAYQSIGCVKAGTKVGKDAKIGDAFVEATAAELENYLCNEHHIFDLWNDGKAYYYAEIQHYPDVEDFKYGVIRNHVYKLELTSISGLGIPVVDPEKIIIPENPEDKLFYVGAKVRILKWRVVPTQKVEFGKQ